MGMVTRTDGIMGRGMVVIRILGSLKAPSSDCPFQHPVGLIQLPPVLILMGAIADTPSQCACQVAIVSADFAEILLNMAAVFSFLNGIEQVFSLFFHLPEVFSQVRIRIPFHGSQQEMGYRDRELERR